MDIHIELQDTDAKFSLFAAASYELTCGGLSVHMSADQFQQLCDNLRPWIAEDAPQPPADAEAVARRYDEILEWISHNLVHRNPDYAMHVLKRGGTGDAGDLRTFVEYSRSRK